MPHRHWPSSVVSLGCLTGIAYFIASGSAALLGGAIAGAAAAGGARPVRALRREPSARAPRDATVILSRNVFDSVVGSRLTPEGGPVSSAAPRECGARYRLISVVASARAAESLAVIEAGPRRDLVRVGARVADDAEVVQIGWRAALLRPSAGPACWIGILSPPAEGLDASAAAAPRRAPSTGDPDLDAAVAAGVRKVGEGAYEIDRALVDRVVASPGALARMRVQPFEQDGTVTGFRVYGVRRGSLPTAIGLENGDVIHSVNDLPMTSPAGALEALQALREVQHLRVGLTRRGQPVNVEVELR